MKLLIAFAAVLSSAALTIPTVTDITETRSSEARLLASLATDRVDSRNA